jgi:hypothetical protein
LPTGSLVAYVTNISSHSRHYRKLAVIRSEVNANLKKRFKTGGSAVVTCAFNLARAHASHFTALGVNPLKPNLI